jgi:hypothetical protein
MYDTDLRSTDIQYLKGKDQYFVGDLALRHSQVQLCGTAERKAKVGTTKVLLETALAMLDPEGDYWLVTGLPVDFYFNQKDEFQHMLEEFNKDTQYRLTVGRNSFTAKPFIMQHKIVPQPLGAAMNLLLNDNGDIKTDFSEVINKDILVIDPGFYTLDLLGLHALEVGAESCSPERAGYDVAFQLIQEDLKGMIGKAPNRYVLDKAVREGDYKGIDLTQIKKRAFQTLAEKINMEVSQLNERYSLYILTGGWASTLLPYLELPKDKTVVFDYRGNVEGYRKIGVRAWKSEL